MSAETTFRTGLVGFAAVTQIAGTRVALSAAEQGWPLPYVIFTSVHTPDRALDGTLLADQVVHTVECWAQTGAGAAALADAVELAVAAMSLTVLTRSPAYDQESNLDAVVLSVEHWIT